MIAALCVDDRGGVSFNGRRQSQDRALRRKLMAQAGSRPVWMSAYSAGQFEPEYAGQIRIAEDFLLRAGPGEFCFLELQSLLDCEDKLEQVILFRWNRLYPADTFLDLPLAQHGWHVTERQDFSGFSHDTITQEVYVR
ncbi:ribonuclease Z [Pseudoflavonifractor sp. AF19-9AC]|uniref:ribonuclease Z n=1 Tax=Pseudoflavonifractor sp. AF19-9AC TaxID=2292244 RepID=UPI000E48F9DC|nr:ribonuclease Z [Pseudoflavonifractor sp. AF19-9AC]RHR06124.1 ribonuclease Z [Pseudoflavonifractor sp. AF19-9AC]